MTKTDERLRNERRTLALAIKQDFLTLLEAVNQAAGANTQSSELASFRAAVERGVTLSAQLLDSIDDAGSD